MCKNLAKDALTLQQNDDRSALFHWNFASFANQVVYGQQQTCKAGFGKKEKKKRQFYSRGACSFKPYFFLLASNIVATFSRSITEVTVYRMDANSAHLQRLCSFQSVITPFLKTCLSPSSQRYLNFFHLELFVSTTFFFLSFFLFSLFQGLAEFLE